MDSGRPPAPVNTPRSSRRPAAGFSPPRAASALNFPAPVPVGEANRPKSARGSSARDPSRQCPSIRASSPLCIRTSAVAPRTPLSRKAPSYSLPRSPVSSSSAAAPVLSGKLGSSSLSPTPPGFLSLASSIEASSLACTPACGPRVSPTSISVRGCSGTSFLRAAPLPGQSPRCLALHRGIFPFREVEGCRSGVSPARSPSRSSSPFLPEARSPLSVARSPLRVLPSRINLSPPSCMPAFCSASVSSAGSFTTSLASPTSESPSFPQDVFDPSLGPSAGTMERLSAHPHAKSSRRQSSLRLRGLENRKGENNCFLNVILQAFWNLRSFRVLCQHAPEHRHPGTSFISGGRAPAHSPSASVDGPGDTCVRGHGPSFSVTTADSFQNARALASCSRLPVSASAGACPLPRSLAGQGSGCHGSRELGSSVSGRVRGQNCLSIEVSKDEKTAEEASRCFTSRRTAPAALSKIEPTLRSQSNVPTPGEPVTLQEFPRIPTREGHIRERCEEDSAVGKRSLEDHSATAHHLCGLLEDSPVCADADTCTHLPLAASCVFCAVKNLFANYQFGCCEVLPAAAVRASLASCWASTRFMPGDMEDADETMVGVLEALHAWHQGLNGPLPSASSLAPLVPPGGSPFSSPRHRPPEDLSNPLDFLAFFRDIPCSPPCLAHALFALRLLFLPRCTSCGATGEPLLQQMYVHRVYAAELLPLLGTAAETVSSVCSSPASSPLLHACPRSPRFQVKNEKLSNLRRQTGAESRKEMPETLSSAAATLSKPLSTLFSRPSESVSSLSFDLSSPLSPNPQNITTKQRPSPRGISTCPVERTSMLAKHKGNSTATGRDASSRSGSSRVAIGGCLRALFLSDSSLVSREALSISPLQESVGGTSAGFTLSPSASTDSSDKRDKMQKQMPTAYDFIVGHEQAQASRGALWGSADVEGSLSIEADMRRFQQLFQLTKAVKLGAHAGRTKQRGASAYKATGPADPGDDSNSRADEDPWGALARRKQRGDCGQCRGSQTVTLDRYCMHAPAIFVCSLVWPPDLAQLPPGVSASEHSPARAATPCSPAVKAPQRADQARDEVRERVLLLLQGLEPVLDVQAIFSELDLPGSSSASSRVGVDDGDPASASPRQKRRQAYRGERPVRAAAAQEVEAFSADVSGKHVFRGMVCFYGQHYICFFYHWASAKWVLFDDSRVKRGLTWKEVLEMCVGGKLLPCLLFFETISLKRSRRIDVSSSSSSSSSLPCPASASSPSSVFVSDSELLCNPSVSQAQAASQMATARTATGEGAERNAPCTTRGEEFFSSSDSERELGQSLPSDAWMRFLDGGCSSRKTEAEEEYGKEGLQLFCAEILSCQSFSLSDLSEKAAKRGDPSVPVGCTVEDGWSNAAPCRVS